MSPDISGSQRAGLAALVAACIAAGVMSWWMWSDQPDIDVRLENARTAAKKITGKEPLRARVERQRKANAELSNNLTELKHQAGFTIKDSYRVPPDEREPGKFFLGRFINVRQELRDEADKKRIERDERLGFPPDDRVPPDGEVPQLLAMLQLTEKALRVVLNAPDPVEWFKISHDAQPNVTGPPSRPPLLKEHTLILEVRGSLKTILWILHSYGQRVDGDFPLVVSYFKVDSDNTKAKDDVQQLEATIKIAGMQFLSDEERGLGATKPVAGTPARTSSGGPRGARP